MSDGKVRLFLSHSSEDKDDFVRPLRDKLLEAGFDVWYDEDSLIVGQSLLRQISEGLKSANYGIVVSQPYSGGSNRAKTASALAVTRSRIAERRREPHPPTTAPSDRK